MSEQRSVTLDLRVGSEPIAGRLRGENGASVPFEGWLELAAALERLLGEHNGDGGGAGGAPNPAA